MKKFYFLLLAAVVAMTTDASAQFVQSTATTNTAKANTTTSTAPDCSGENFYVGYNIASVKWSLGQPEMEEAFPLNSGITAGYNKRMGLNVSSFPLYVDYGANFSYMFGSSEYTEEDDYYEIDYKYENSVNVASINVPLAVTTPFQVDNITILPYVGVNLRFNLFGKQKEAVEASYDGEDLSKSETYDLFNKDDMDGYPFGRFQAGLNLGVNIEYEKYTVGIGYVNDFSPVYKGFLSGTFSATTISVGYKF
jgi:opacity protein-like surface antigen